MDNIKVYQPPGEVSQVEAFIEDLHPKLREKLVCQIFRLSRTPPTELKEPHYKHFSIEKYREFYELRELSINEALMNAAQDCSTQHASDHRPYDYLILPQYGWPYGAAYNLAILDGDNFDKAATTSISLWINSPGHLQTMLEENATCVGTGVSVAWGRIYSYMVVGSPKWANAYT